MAENGTELPAYALFCMLVASEWNYYGFTWQIIWTKWHLNHSKCHLIPVNRIGMYILMSANDMEMYFNVSEW